MEKSTIKAVHNYFRDKLIKGEFEIIKVKEHCVSVLIDKEYPFIIWTANEDYGIQTYQNYSDGESFMSINFRVKDKEALWRKLKNPLKEFKENELFQTKKAEFEKLKKELNIQD